MQIGAAFLFQLNDKSNPSVKRRFLLKMKQKTAFY